MSCTRAKTFRNYHLEMRFSLNEFCYGFIPVSYKEECHLGNSGPTYQVSSFLANLRYMKCQKTSIGVCEGDSSIAWNSHGYSV